MKKLTAILLALFLALSLTACKKDDPVKAKEPDIPGTTAAPSGGDTYYMPPEDPVVSNDPVDTAVPDVTPADPAPAPAGDEKEEQKPSAGVTASHSDVSLFSEGEKFTMSAQGVNGIYAASFASKNPEIASVDEKTGVITAAAPGMTTITMHVECEAGQFDFDCIVRCRWEAEEAVLPGGDTDPGTVADPGTPAQPETPSVSTASLSGFFSTLQGKYEGLGTMMVLDGELLENYYPGLSSISAVEEVLIQETAISTANIAVGLVKLSDDATLTDVLQVQSVFQNRISAQANGGAFYPASCETWENGVITSVSNCVGMFVYPDSANSMASLFTETFGN